MQTNKITIRQAIIEVLKKSSTPLTPKEIYDQILQENLYHFKAKEPINIIKSEIRAYCEGIQNKTSKPEKFFKEVNGKYTLIN